MNLKSDLRIGFVGAGKVGTTLGAYFRSKGLNIAGYASRNPESSQRAAKITSSQSLTMNELVADCDMLWITTPDTQIKEVWKALNNCCLDGKIIIHCSGAMSSEVFQEIAEKNAFGYSIHPMFAFAHQNGDFDGLKSANFTVEGDPTRLEVIRQYFNILGNPVFIIDRQDKPNYHLANVMVTNLVLALIHLGTECLSQCSSFQEVALPALLPMIQNNLDNLKRSGFIDSLTGPVERNDLETIKKHLQCLAPLSETIYKELSKRLVTLSAQKHPEQNYAEILHILS